MSRRCAFGCGKFVGASVWCRDCAPETPCRDYPPTCAPGPDGVCCMEEAALERIAAAAVARAEEGQ